MYFHHHIVVIERHRGQNPCIVLSAGTEGAKTSLKDAHMVPDGGLPLRLMYFHDHIGIVKRDSGVGSRIVEAGIGEAQWVDGLRLVHVLFPFYLHSSPD